MLKAGCCLSLMLICQEFWEKKPLHIRRDDPAYFKTLFSTKALDKVRWASWNVPSPFVIMMTNLSLNIMRVYYIILSEDFTWITRTCDVDIGWYLYCPSDPTGAEGGFREEPWCDLLHWWEEGDAQSPGGKLIYPEGNLIVMVYDDLQMSEYDVTMILICSESICSIFYE